MFLFSQLSAIKKAIMYICVDGTVNEPDMSANFCPDHKAPMVLFLDRVYGIKDQSFLLHLLEVGFLPDLRASASLDTVSILLWRLDAVAGYGDSINLINRMLCKFFFFFKGKYMPSINPKRNSLVTFLFICSA